MKIELIIAFSLLMASCSPGFSIPPSTEIASNKPLTLFYPPCAPSRSNLSSTPTASIPGGSSRELNDELRIEEYHSYVSNIHLDVAGCEYAGHQIEDTAIYLGNSYEVVIRPMDIQTELVRVFQGNVEVFQSKTLTYGSSGLLQAWGYDDHWVIEIKTESAEYGVDIIYDGQSLKKVNGYDNAFGFQILNNKPFFFFRRSGEWGINYDGHEILLDYEEIPYTNVSIGMDPSILQYQNMVLFQAKRNSEMYSVVIGAFH